MSHPPVSSMIPGTEYFELDSARVGARLGIWVTVPPGYALESVRYPVLYVTDGNTQVAVTAPLSHAMMLDPIRPVQPYIQVTIGYTGDDVQHALRIRNRDLVPAAEPYPPQMGAHIYARVQAGLFSAAEHAALLEELHDTHAENFLDFIEQELHPYITERYRAESAGAGLFGYSYGGLFTLYAFTSGTPLFSRYGASSPAIVVPDSQVYSLYEGLCEKGDQWDVRLHLTVNDTEGSGPNEIYRTLSVEYLRFIDLLKRRPLPGLRMTSATIVGETHASGIVDAYRSFVRTCYAASLPA